MQMPDRSCQSCPWWSLPFLCCTKMQQGRLFTWLSFGSAQPSKAAQSSVGANMPRSLREAH
jgi:hypothetical protein